MAHILPDTPPQSLPNEVLRVYKAFKYLPDSYFIWHHLAPWQIDTPDFLMITKDFRTLIVKVSSASSTQTSPATQLLLIENDQSTFGMAEGIVLNSFVQSLNLSTPAIETLVVFPNIPTKQVLESRIIRNPGDPQWIGREILQNDAQIKWEDFLPTSCLDQVSVEIIRQKFTPEIVVTQEMTVRSTDNRRLDAGLTDYLLDYNQELAVKSDLEVNSEGQDLSRDFNLNIINGVAGSGKTLILLFRLRLLVNLFPQKSFLILTHNKPLSHDIQSRFTKLHGYIPENTEWGTFYGWCYSHWPKKIPWINPISKNRRERIIHDVWEDILQDSIISERMMASEIDWIKDQLPISEMEYLSIDRKGRRFGLTTEQRKLMWKAKNQYQKILEDEGVMDWGDIPQHLWTYLIESEENIVGYDFLFIDEAQFFAPIWVNILQKVMKPKSSSLFIVADPTQGFLGRKATWKSIGLEARGHSHLLKRSYRTTREIMKFASLLYRTRLPNDIEEEVLLPDFLSMPSGAVPEIITMTSSQDEISRIANEVAAFVNQGFPKKHLLLLHANGEGASALIQAIDHRLGKNSAIDPKDTYPGDYVRVTTLNAGAGIESPIVFLVGLRELFEEEQSIRFSDEEKIELIRDNTRKIYMATTRAGQRLVISYVGKLPDEIQRIIPKKLKYPYSIT